VDEPLPSEPEVIREIARVVEEELGLAQAVGPQTELQKDLALDSITLLTLAVALEDRFRVLLREEDAPGLHTVEELARLVVQRAKERTTP
jgi:acyl carrier protein